MELRLKIQNAALILAMEQIALSANTDASTLKPMQENAELRAYEDAIPRPQRFVQLSSLLWWWWWLLLL
jgi:hypothetical protein